MSAVALAARPGLVVVDDEPQVLRAIEDQLEDEFDVHAAASGESALELLRELNDVSVLLSDQRMPGMTGDELLARAAEVGDATPVLITGYADLEAVILAVNRGRIFGYLTKPWDAQTLRATIGKAAEHHRLVRGLRESEARHRAVFEQAAVGIAHTSLDGRFLLANDKFCGLSGYPIAELLRLGIRDLTHADDFDAAAGLRARLISGEGASFDREIRLLRKEGAPFWASVTTSLVRGVDGRPSYFVSLLNDITQRRLAERDLQRFRLAMDVSLDSIYLTHAGTMRFLYVNDAACRRLGYLREQLLQMGPQDVLGADEIGIRREYDAVVKAGEAGLTVESRYLRSDGSDGWSELRRRALQDNGDHVIATIGRDITERKTAEARIAQLNRVHAVLSGTNAAIVRIRDRDELFQECCRIAHEAGGFGAVWIGVVDPQGGAVSPVAWRAPEAAVARLRELRFPIRANETGAPPSMLMEMATSRQAVIANDALNDPRARYKEDLAAFGIGSVAFLPLVQEGDLTGVLALYSSVRGFFDTAEVKLLAELAGDLSFALEHIDKSRQADYLAFYDELTGLANRRLFADRLANFAHAAGQASGKLAVALFDIERLRSVNESLGRHAGDALLREVGARLAQQAGQVEVARVSADQFAVVLPDVRGRSEVGRRVEQVLHGCIEPPFNIAGSQLRVAAKAGVALFPADGADAELLLRNAEAAMRKAKATGERIRFYEAALTAGAVENMALESRLRRALVNDEFVLHYQPKHDVETGRIVGGEALIRWQSPELGLVPPGKFIRLMEETGLILEVGAWALQRAAADHRAWTEQGVPAPRVAVNVSAIQLRQRGFVASVERAIAGGIAPTGIDIEITESLVMENVEENIGKLRSVRELGVQIAIDDFGTGYSSLGYLARLPVQALKIDRSFIITMLKDPTVMTLVQTIVSLAHTLDLKVIAEGVDEEEQAKYLRLLRCDQMQGYLFSKPVPFAEMTELLRDRAQQAAAKP